MSPTAARVLCLARVSGQAQASDGTSLEAQQETFTAYCLASHLPDPIIYVEIESAGDTRQDSRVEVERLIADASPGDVVLVTKVDRWSRNLPWGVASVRALVKRGVGFRSIGEGIDASTSNGDFVLGIMVAVADQERQRIRERTVGARQRLRAQGFHVEGHAPLGFRVEGGRGTWRLAVDEAQAPAVRLMFALALADHSTREIATALRSAFPSVTGLDSGNLARRLKDRRYIGESCSRGSRSHKPTDGEWMVTHAAIVDADTWHRTQAALASRRMGGRRNAEDSRTAGFLLRGILACAHCGGIMRAHSPEADASIRHSGYYVCARRTERKRTAARAVGAEPCAGPLVRRDHADEQVTALALERLDALAVELAEPAPARAAVDFEGERAKLLRKRARVVGAIADETISAEAARSTVAELEAQLAAVNARQAADVAPVNRAEVLATVGAMRKAWERMKVDERREALRYLADAVEARSTATRKWERGAWTVAVMWHAFD